MAFERKETKLSTGPVSYYKAGSGQPVLYLHSGTGVRFTEPLDKLAENYTVYMPIFPGYDGTAAHDGVKGAKALAGVFKEFAEKEMGGDKVDVIGHSIGGWIAAWLGVLMGDNVDQLILVASGGFRTPGTPPMPSDPAVLRKLAYVYPEKIKPDGRTPEQGAKNREMIPVYVGGVSYDEELIARLPEISALTMIVHGEKDGTIPESSSTMLRNRIKKSHLIFLYDAGHVPEIDQPERFSRLVGDFLSRGEAFLVNWGSQAPAGSGAPAAA